VTTIVESGVMPYEVRLDRDRRWALVEGSRHFEKQSAVHDALLRICERLTGLGIPYAVCGGMALFQHGLRRFTEDVDLLVTKDDLLRIHQSLEGRGYLPAFAGSKHLRDTEKGVRIEFLVSGQYPGDGKPKPVAFPHPEAASVDVDGVRYLRLSALIELKLASGMTASHRAQDLVDVQRLIATLDLPLNLSEELDPFVRSKFVELWKIERGAPIRRLRRWPARLPAMETKTADELIALLAGADQELASMLRDGVTIERCASDPNDVLLVTTDPEVARKYDMHEESEFFGIDESDEELRDEGDR
jgi:hypothetical protein